MSLDQVDTPALLLDLEAVARGESPLQVHKGLDQKTLSRLAKDDGTTGEETAEMASIAPDNLKTVLYVLLGLLGVSVLVNIIQAAVR